MWFFDLLPLEGKCLGFIMEYCISESILHFQLNGFDDDDDAAVFCHLPVTENVLKIVRLSQPYFLANMKWRVDHVSMEEFSAATTTRT